MDTAGALDFVRAHPRAVLATLRRDGGPQLTPVLAAVDDADRVIVSTRARSAKVANLRRDPRAWLCVLTDDFFGGFAQIAATADIVVLPEAMDALVDYYRRLSGEHPDWDDYRAAMNREDRVLLRLQVQAAGPG